MKKRATISAAHRISTEQAPLQDAALHLLLDRLGNLAAQRCVPVRNKGVIMLQGFTLLFLYRPDKARKR